MAEPRLGPRVDVFTVRVGARGRRQNYEPDTDHGELAGDAEMLLWIPFR
jgi:hypothetical protein